MNHHAQLNLHIKIVYRLPRCKLNLDGNQMHTSLNKQPLCMCVDQYSESIIIWFQESRSEIIIFFPDPPLLNTRLRAFRLIQK